MRLFLLVLLKENTGDLLRNFMNVVYPSIRWSFKALQKMKKKWKGGSSKQTLPLCLQVNNNLECLVLQPCHLVSLSWFIVHQDLVKPWQMSLVVQHPLWSQRISVSGPRQLRWSGTRLGQYGLKRLICCGNITMRSTVGRNNVEILSRRCLRWLLVWISFMRLACIG